MPPQPRPTARGQLGDVKSKATLATLMSTNSSPKQLCQT